VTRPAPRAPPTSAQAASVLLSSGNAGKGHLWTPYESVLLHAVLGLLQGVPASAFRRILNPGRLAATWQAYRRGISTPPGGSAGPA